MSLTKLLYDKFDTASSLTLSFATSSSIHQILFWCEELLQSNIIDELFESLWLAYYLFYAKQNKHIEKYISTKFELYQQQHDNKHIYHIISKLFISPKSSHIYNILTSQLNNNSKNKLSLLKGKSPSWCCNYNKISHQILRFLDKHEYLKAIQHIIKYHSSNSNDSIQYIHQDIIKFFNIQSPFKYKHSPLHHTLIISHSIYIILNKLNFITNDYQNNIILKNPDFNNKYKKNNLHDESNILTDINIPQHLFNHILNKQPNCEQNYHILTKYRLYNIHPDIHNIIPTYISPNLNSIRYNWTSFLNTPIWIQRIKQHNGDYINNNITFNNINDEEDFYNNYNMEFDEQPLHIQQRSIRKYE
tara:strand:+ start:611 stop:1690 length:1080 start_codon:yes stop_codon:yes gene_type:complete